MRVEDGALIIEADDITELMGPILRDHQFRHENKLPDRIIIQTPALLLYVPPSYPEQQAVIPLVWEKDFNRMRKGKVRVGLKGLDKLAKQAEVAENALETVMVEGRSVVTQQDKAGH